MRITDYKPGDEEQILQLFEKSFGKPLSEKFWNWRFLDNPINQVMIKLMWDGDLLVGHYAASPVRLLCDGEPILTALSMTTMTHPDYAGKGIFSQLAEALYQTEAEQSQLKAVWGYPNNNSHYAFMKNLKWNNLESVPTFSLAARNIRNIPHSNVNQVTAFSEKHALAAQFVSKEFRVKVDKSLEYLNWRYGDHPENTYEIFERETNGQSFFVVSKIFPSFDVKGKYEVDILELAVPDDAGIIAEFLSEMALIYSAYDLLKINLWLPLNDPKHITLEKLGFVNAAPVTYFGIKLLDTAYSPLLENKNWDYSMGYSDIY